MIVLQVSLIARVIDHLVSSVEVAVPRLVTALVLLVVAFLGITVIITTIRFILARVYPPEERLVVNLITVVVAIFLWFGVALSLLKVLGLDDIAASVGTAVGFIALGVSYALSEMIEDTVAGVYLLRDPNFNIGDTIEADDVDGEILAIELRKTRIREDDGAITVMANRAVESRWTQRAS